MYGLILSIVIPVLGLILLMFLTFFKSKRFSKKYPIKKAPPSTGPRRVIKLLLLSRTYPDRDIYCRVPDADVASQLADEFDVYGGIPDNIYLVTKTEGRDSFDN